MSGDTDDEHVRSVGGLAHLIFLDQRVRSQHVTERARRDLYLPVAEVVVAPPGDVRDAQQGTATRAAPGQQCDLVAEVVPE
jgi:hypothetical protein